VADLAFDAVDEKQRELLMVREELLRTNLLLAEKSSGLDTILNSGLKGPMLLMELQPLYPEIINCTYTESYIQTDSILTRQVFLVFTTVNGQPDNVKRQNIRKWAIARLGIENVKVFFDSGI
jgi:hypothetical protein